jgi:hypothetical protein
MVLTADAARIRNSHPVSVWEVTERQTRAPSRSNCHRRVKMPAKASRHRKEPSPQGIFLNADPPETAPPRSTQEPTIVGTGCRVDAKAAAGVSVVRRLVCARTERERRSGSRAASSPRPSASRASTGTALTRVGRAECRLPVVTFGSTRTFGSTEPGPGSATYAVADWATPRERLDTPRLLWFACLERRPNAKRSSRLGPGEGADGCN